MCSANAKEEEERRVCAVTMEIKYMVINSVCNIPN